MQTLNTEYSLMQHEELIISAASKTSVTGAAAGVVGTVSQVDILTLTGVLIAVSGLQIENSGSSSYNLTQPANVWLAGTTATTAIIKYKIAGYSGNFAIRAMIS